ncbi:hypothetical protein Tco_1280604 [Tanacetum coccineum]
MVIPSGFQELEVRKDDQSYGVNLQHKGQNKATCKADPTPKPPVEKNPPSRNKQSAVGYCASRGRGRGRGGSENEASGSGMGGIDEVSGNRAVGSTRGGMDGSSSIGILTSEELDKEAFKECMEEQAREQAKNDAEQERLDKEKREEREWEEKNDYLNPFNFRGDSLEEASFNHTYAEVFIPSIHSQPTQQSDVWVKDTTDVTINIFDEFPGMEISATTNVAEGIGSAMPPSHVDGVRIYHKNRGRSERIANMKEKKAFEFDKHGTGSIPDKAFDVSN